VSPADTDDWLADTRTSYDTGPGLVQLPQLRPDLGQGGPIGKISLSAYCGGARKPLIQ